MTQMGRACNSSEAKWICQGDDGSSPWLEDLKGPSTTPQEEFVIYLIDTNLALNVTWGDLSQRFWAASLLGRISYESMPSHLHPAFSLNHLVCSTLFAPQRDSPQRFRAPPLSPLPSHSPRPSPIHCLAQTFTSRPMLGPASSNIRFLDLKKSSPLQNCVPPSNMENRQKNHNAPRIMNLQGVKGLLVGLDQPDPEMECAGCQRL
jgi:hypothetical protein